MGNVLVIDDDAAVCDALSELLSHMGHIVDTAMRRETGLEQATSHLTRWLVHEAPRDLDRAVLTEEVTQLLLRYLKA